MVKNFLDLTLRARWLWMAIVLTLPSVGQAYKYSGIPGFVVFTSVFAAFIFLIDKKWNRLSITLLNRNIALALTISIVVFLFGIFVVIYPDANAGLYGGGSDADDALKIGAEAILNLQNPYHLRTYLDLPITPGLGAISLSIPFYLLGNVSYQNFFWLFLLIFFIHRHFRDISTTFLFLLLMYLLNPLALVQIATGVDHLTNGIYVFLFLLIFVKLFDNPGTKKGLLILSAIMLGIGITSRMNFIFIIPILFAHMYHLSDWKTATKWTSLIVCTLLLLSLPLYLNDTEAFAPIRNAAGRIGNSSDPIQIQTLLVGFIATVATGVLCYKKFNLTETSVFCNVALVQIISISATVIIRAIIDWDIEAKDLITFDYAAFVIPFFTFVFVSKVHSYGDHTYIRLSGHHPRQH